MQKKYNFLSYFIVLLFEIFIITIIIIQATTFLTSCTRIQSDKQSRTQKENGFKFPLLAKQANFVLKTLEGGTLTLSSLKGKVVVLNFWATWCPPCKAEIPDFIEAYSEYKDRGVEFLGISNEDIDIIRNFAEEYKINYTLCIDESSEFFNLWSIHSIPTTFIIDENSNVVYAQIGLMTKDKLTSEIENALENE